MNYTLTLDTRRINDLPEFSNQSASGSIHARGPRCFDFLHFL